MFNSGLPNYVTTKNQRIFAGLGTVAKVVSNGEEVYKNKLDFDEVKKRIETCYHPYHIELKRLIDQTRDIFGFCILIDCHSMPATDQYNRHLPDIVLGDCHGRTLEPDIRKRIDNFIRSKNFTIGWNAPYSGGYITSNYGKAARPGQSLQIEINRSLYMHRPQQIDADGAARVSALLASLLVFLDTTVKS